MDVSFLFSLYIQSMLTPPDLTQPIVVHISMIERVKVPGPEVILFFHAQLG